jgi:4-hydroxybenzoate polyprenyltransferase
MSAVARVHVYLREMFPLSRRVPEALLLYGSLSVLLARTQGRPSTLVSIDTLRGALAALVFMLMLRLMDELKDVDTDRALFPGRALPSGRVRECDLVALLGLSAPAFVLLHLGRGIAAFVSFGVVFYALLMFRWFFVPARMRGNLPLTLASHAPVVPLLLVDLALLWADARGIAAAELRVRPLGLIVLAYWAAVFAWEIARKIRAPEEETGYVTYSRLLGPRAAVTLAAGAQLLSLAAGLALVFACRLRPWAGLPVLAGVALALAAHARFLRRPDAHTQRLRPFAEAQVVGLFVGGLLA